MSLFSSNMRTTCLLSSWIVASAMQITYYCLVITGDNQAKNSQFSILQIVRNTLIFFRSTHSRYVTGVCVCVLLPLTHFLFSLRFDQCTNWLSNCTDYRFDYNENKLSQIIGMTVMFSFCRKIQPKLESIEYAISFKLFEASQFKTLTYNLIYLIGHIKMS